MMPILSVCIPNYNHGAVLGETLTSVLSKNVTANLDDVEVLISDNASTDNSLSIIAPWRSHPNLRVLEQPHTLPMSSHWNRVIQAAKANWVLVLSSDDILLPQSLDTLKAVIKSTEADAIFFEYDFLTPQGRVSKCPFYRNSAIILGEEQSKIFLKGNNFPLSACLFRRKALEQLGGFDETKVFCTDWHAWLGLSARASKIIYIKEPLMLYRQHEANETHRCIENLSALKEVIAMKQDFINKNKVTDPDVLWGALNNDVKLAHRYAEIMKSRQLEQAYLHYQKQVTLLTNKLTSLRSTKPMPMTAPYPLPWGSEIIELANLALK
ncbi:MULTISPECIES: glycosyltransferase family 2 protein [Shewanella]|uniref:Glycosyltransferase n=1 Tax=Shewanella xiamenensis TaxID=332186 RepID=A0AAE4Q1J7_9GAMM|nr:MULTISPECIES: glycosyltransferase [Shewanella]MDH1625556.1 glycosyltransferase [Shewanella xiamenensis]MDV5245592.1 glycosyltransferase [Shewanella xiamenensis]MDV5391053.1 glycosyltransferase [Shewanella xiamenensis]BDQ65383.1 hypothetical protein NUITMVS2_11950 [Shewanella xiamenensis]GLD77036.1 hypothetical protein NUITMVS3_14670 [Shewanella xiamenensis]